MLYLRVAAPEVVASSAPRLADKPGEEFFLSKVAEFTSCTGMFWLLLLANISIDFYCSTVAVFPVSSYIFIS